ncbi:hypothetical protein [Lederbergia graminis]|uniref:Uncharacterized protein n=1 Tax=Lederbergia graminis TaxID=735518 RepID=A0ABW0LCD0_9BACI
MKKIKRHLPILTLIASIILLTVLLSKVHAAKSNANFIWKDVKGERSVLNGISISGELADAYHRTKFIVENGKVNYKTDVLDIPQTMYQQQSEKEFTFHRAGQITNNFEVELKDYSKTPSSSYARIITDIEYNLSKSLYGVSFVNTHHYGLTTISDKVFYTAPTSSNAGGVNGIYELKFTEYYINTIQEKYNPRTLTTFELNKVNDQTGIQVLGLEAVGNKLALILIKNHKLTIRVFDSETGTQLGETNLKDDFFIGDQENPEAKEVHRSNYDSFSYNDLLILSFPSLGSTENDSKKTIISIDFTDEVKIIGINKGRFTNSTSRDSDNIEEMYYKNNKLYIVNTAVDRAKENDVNRAVLLPKYIKVYVYDENGLIYEGRLETDIHDDYLRFTNEKGSIGINNDEFRNFMNVSIY